MTQKFKGNALELQYDAASATLLDQLSANFDDFLDGAYECEQLGQIIFADHRSPLTNAIPQDVFVQSFNTIFQAFVKVGTFEAYLDVFRRIFGDTVVVVFTVPGPGLLDIDITSNSPVSYYVLGRELSHGVYTDFRITDETMADELIGIMLKGFQTQQEVERMLYEMVPAGIFTTITLTLG